MTKIRGRPREPLPTAASARMRSNLDSSVVIDAGRCGGTVERLIERVVAAASDSGIETLRGGLDGLVHSLYRANPNTSALIASPSSTSCWPT
jgi:hypothetical protein